MNVPQNGTKGTKVPFITKKGNLRQLHIFCAKPLCTSNKQLLSSFHSSLCWNAQRSLITIFSNLRLCVDGGRPIRLVATCTSFTAESKLVKFAICLTVNNPGILSHHIYRMKANIGHHHASDQRRPYDCCSFLQEQADQ